MDTQKTQEPKDMTEQGQEPDPTTDLETTRRNHATGFPAAGKGSSNLNGSSNPNDSSGSDESDDLEVMDTVSLPMTHIIDTPPKRVHDLNDLLGAAGSILGAILFLVAAIGLQGVTRGVEHDVHTFGVIVTNWLYVGSVSFLQQFVTVAVIIMVLIQLSINREWIQLATCSLSLILGVSITFGVAELISLIHYPPLFNELQSIDGLLPGLIAGIAAFLTSAGPRKARSMVRLGWTITFTLGALLVMLSADTLSSLVVALLLGRAIGLVIRFAIGTLNVGVWGKGVVEALREVGLDIHFLRSHPNTLDRPDASVRVSHQTASLADDLIVNSRLYDAVDADGQHFTVSILDERRHSAGYLRQLLQWFQLSDLSTRHDRTVRNACHHHIDMLLGLRNIGLSTIHPYAVTDAQESGIIIFYKDCPLHECDWETITDEDVVYAMDYLAKANKRGYTHRRITPASIVRDKDGQVILAGWENGDFASVSSNVSLDRAQLLTVFAVKLGVERTVKCAVEAWGKDYVYNLTAFIQRAAIPLETRQAEGWTRHLLKDLRTAINGLIPEDEADNTETVTIARFNVRNFVGLVLLIVAAVVIFTQMKPADMVSTITHANPWWAVVSFLLGAVITSVATSISVGVFVDRDKLHLVPLFLSQVAQGFTAITMPAGVGPAFMNLQYLRKAGYKSTRATAIMSAVVAVQVAATVLLMIVIGIFTGRNTLSGAIPTSTISITLGVVALLLSIIMAIKPLRQLFVKKVFPIVRSYGHELATLITQPKKLLICVVGSLLQNASLGLAFWASLMAFGYTNNPIETTFIFLLANTVGSAVPTPGGLGAVEAALTLAFSGIGVPSAIALSATLLYRIMSYWARIPFGAAAMQWLNKHDLI